MAEERTLTLVQEPKGGEDTAFDFRFSGTTEDFRFYASLLYPWVRDHKDFTKYRGIITVDGLEEELAEHIFVEEVKFTQKIVERLELLSVDTDYYAPIAKSALGVAKKHGFFADPENPLSERFDRAVTSLIFRTKSLYKLENESAMADALGIAKAYDGDKLPDIEELYSTHKREGESALDFLERVWGAYMWAGLVYQNDIRHSDGKLISAVNSYCHYRKFDPKLVLPPPARVRTDRGLAEAEPGSPTEGFYRARLLSRERSARWRAKAKGQTPTPD